MGELQVRVPSTRTSKGQINASFWRRGYYTSTGYTCADMIRLLRASRLGSVDAKGPTALVHFGTISESQDATFVDLLRVTL